MQTERLPGTSIIIPCYNYGRFLAEAIESALGQTHQPGEVIVVDDGSTDDSLAVAQHYSWHPLVQVISQANRGAIATFNSAIRASRCEYFVILSADDRLDVRYLKKTVPVLEHDSAAGYVYTAYRMFGARHRVLNAPPYSKRRLLLRPYITGTALIRRDAFDQCGGFSAEMEGGHEDWEFFIALAECGWHGVAVPDVLFHYRQHLVASRNTQTSRHWLGVRKHVYRRHRSVYGKVPFPAYVAMVAINQQWLRARAAPRVLCRALGSPMSRPPGARAVVPFPDHDDRIAGTCRLLRCPEIEVVVARPGSTARLAVDEDRHVPAQDSIFDRPPTSGANLFSALVATTIRAVHQRAAIYHACNSTGLIVAAIAATFNHAMLVYEPDVACKTGKGWPAAIFGKAIECIVQPRIDMLLLDADAVGEVRARCAMPPMLVQRHGLMGEPVRREGTDPARIEQRRLAQLYRDLLHVHGLPAPDGSRVAHAAES